MRRVVTVAVLLVVFAGGCADASADPCAVLAEPLPTLDDAGSAPRWRMIASALDGEPAAAAEALAVVAEQVAALGPEAALEETAAVALRPAAAAHLAVVVAYRSEACGS